MFLTHIFCGALIRSLIRSFHRPIRTLITALLCHHVVRFVIWNNGKYLRSKYDNSLYDKTFQRFHLTLAACAKRRSLEIYQRSTILMFALRDGTRELARSCQRVLLHLHRELTRSLRNTK